jgi:FkbM family methyltransferase
MQKITLDDDSFLVEDYGIAQNYSDVSKMFRCLKNLGINEKAIIFDIGANIGIFSLSYAILFKAAQVYSFEPVPFIYETLENNLSANPDLSSRIKTFNFGLSNTSVELELSIPSKSQHQRYDAKNDLNCGLFSVHGKSDNKILGKFVTLDSFFNEQKLQGIDFMKIDVEGHEFEVLEGGKETIAQFKPIIFMEFNELTRTLSHRSMKMFEDFFEGQGYSLFGLEYGWKEELTPLSGLTQVEHISDVVGIFEA